MAIQLWLSDCVYPIPECISSNTYILLSISSWFYYISYLTFQFYELYKHILKLILFNCVFAFINNLKGSLHRLLKNILLRNCAWIKYNFDSKVNRMEQQLIQSLSYSTVVAAVIRD